MNPGHELGLESGAEPSDLHALADSLDITAAATTNPNGRCHPAMSIVTSEPGGSAYVANDRRTLSIDQSTVIGP